MKLGFLAILVVFLFLQVYVNCVDYLIVSPGVCRAGQAIKLGVDLFGGKSCEVKINLIYSYAVVSRANGIFHSNQSGELELMVPHYLIFNYLFIDGTVCGHVTERKNIRLNRVKKRIFIQTDKPIYKLGQKVQMRIVSIDTDLKPFGTKVSSVTVKEASGSKIMQWNDVKLEDGIASLDLQLSKEPVLGTWSIRAVVGKNYARKYIEIAKYVLPKFELVVKRPPYLALDMEEFTTSICAKYTYGKSVKGMLEAELCVLIYWNIAWKPICHKIVREINGCTEITFSRNELFPSFNIRKYAYFYNIYLRINATVTEASTGVMKNAMVKTTKMVRDSRKITFTGTPYQFKPGFPFQFTIKVTHIDGTPVDGINGVMVNIRCHRDRDRGHGETLIYDRNILVKNGVSTQIVNSVPYNARKLHLQAEVRLWRKSALFHTVTAWYSPSLSYVQISKAQKVPAKVNQEGSVKVIYNVHKDTGEKVDFHYKVMCKGNLVFTDTYTHEINFTEEQQERPTTKPTLVNYTTDEVRTDGSAEQMHTLSASAQSSTPPKPVLREFEIRFLVTQEMVPFCRFLVYYVRSDKETVADSIIYDVEDTLENKVSVNFADEEKRPGLKTKLILKGKPGSRIAVAAVDKSILLLRGGNEIRKSEIIGILNGLDVGRTYSDDYKCRYHWFFKRLHKDVSEAFNVAGVVFFSNLNIFTRECNQDWDKIPIKPTTEPWKIESLELPATYTEAQFVTTEAPVLATLRNTDASPLASIGPVTHKPTSKKNRPQRKQQKAKVRTNFPETWLWTDIKFNETTGERSLEVQVPDTITTWVVNGFAMSSTFGMGVSDQASIRAFQPFFVQINLPFSVIRGEEITITATVFNYMTSCVPIKLELDHTSLDFKVTSYHISKLCVCGDSAKSAKFHIIPNKLGHISLTVKAQTSSAKLCSNATVAAADAVSRKLLVEAEGIKQEYTKGTFFCPEDGYNETFDLNLPKNIVPGSVYPILSISGDVMGPAVSNLDGLLAMPYGCGEQNMAKFAPNIYIMDYLTKSNQVTEKIKHDAVFFMRSGYQRELTFKRKSGSYSAFGEWDAQGSMMLTAFVVRSYAKAKTYIFVDTEEIQHSIRWFSGKQLPSGCFPKYGRVLNKRLQSGLNSELTITAYVTIALIEVGKTAKSRMVSNALTCIAKQIDYIEDTYTIALVAYTLSLANHPKAGDMIKLLKGKGIIKGDEMYWSSTSDNPRESSFDFHKEAPSTDVEITGYALLALLKDSDFNLFKDSLKIIKWLTKQRNSYGGFSSTQDTCVALESLSKVAHLFTRSGSTEASIKIRDKFKYDFTITEQNRLMPQRVEIPGKLLPNQLEITANGTGCALLQATVRYNIPEPEETPAFKVNVEVLQRDALAGEQITVCHPLQLKITAKWLKKDFSNMAIVDVKLPSGFSVNEESLERTLTDQPQEQLPTFTEEPTTGPVDEIQSRKDPLVNFKKYEIQGQHVMLYFDEIKYLSFNIDVIQTTLVKKLKPAFVKVYDYYNPESQAKAMYEITEKNCYGGKIEKECPRCLSVTDLKDLFKNDINCSSYLIRAKSKEGMMHVKRSYIKSDKRHNRVLMQYTIPEFCPCDEIYDGAVALMFSQKDYFKNDGEDDYIALDSVTTIVKWKGKDIKKLFLKKIKKIYRKCSQAG